MFILLKIIGKLSESLGDIERFWWSQWAESLPVSSFRLRWLCGTASGGTFGMDGLLSEISRLVE